MIVSLEVYERSRDAVMELLRKRTRFEMMDAYLLAAECVQETLNALDPGGEWRAPLEAEVAEKKRLKK
jgi:hypothetical protein